MPIPKDETYWLVLNTAIALDFECGHKRWTISDLSRKSGVTRSLIYYYFGKSRAEILTEAVKVVGTEIFGFHERELKLWQEGNIAESILDASKIMAKSPHLAGFYFTHRMRDSEIGTLLRKMELKYFKRLKAFFPKANPDDLVALFAVFLGLTLTPEIEMESLDRFVNAALQVVAV